MASSNACEQKDKMLKSWKLQGTDKLSAVLIKFVNLFSQLAGFFWGVQDLVEEDGEVKSQTQADGMCGVHLSGTDVKRSLVRFLWVLNGL